ncbi:TolB family protein [Micromonospora coxensis]|uniref:WD40-like Beta Propeller Repeat n=1 Tax=Micromonospora coxensis TaxID=356852 RepID=A0A1C5GYM6_9ACTN|nr:hypothetical protein [Micromonospora coxensis]SCG38864.1 hypothetical protein GA0070614_0571 [Micromonospora coxensis]
MSLATKQRPAKKAAARPTAPRRAGIAAVTIAVAASAYLLVRPIPDPPPPPPDRSAAAVWPRAERADIPGNLSDGPLFNPRYFLDARTAVGTAASPDGETQRLVLRNADGTVRELRRRPQDSNPDFSNVTSDGATLVWTEQTAGRPIELWAADVRGGPARRLTADTGNALFFGSQYDVLVRDGRAFWAAGRGTNTEIRNVDLRGGPVTKRTQPGKWGLTAWPWIRSGGLDTATAKLKDLSTNREITVATNGSELATCSPEWCRVEVMSAAGQVRIDMMRPDGTQRQQIGGPTALAAVADAALLNRFVVLSETGAGADPTAAGLLVYDLTTKRAVEITSAASATFARGRVLWWSTGDPDAPTWHTLDLRTV